MSFFGEMLKKGIRKPLEYPNKTKKYLDEKALAERASRYEKNAIKNGEQFVSAPQFKKNARLEKNKKEVDNYNKILSENTRNANGDLENKLADMHMIDSWRNEHSKETNAYATWMNHKMLEYNEAEEMIREGIENAERVGNVKEVARLNRELEKLESNFGNLSHEPEFYRNFNYDNPLEYNADEYISELAKGVNDNLPEISPIMDSNQKNITRYHTTEMKNLPGILKQGLLSNKGGEGYGKALMRGGAKKDELGGVYTFSRSPEYSSPSARGDFSIGDFEGVTYSPENYNNLTLELTIPKTDYKAMPRIRRNPEEKYTLYMGKSDGLPTVQEGGRTDIFKNDVSPEYISGMWNSDLSKTKDWEDIIKNYNCGEDCNDWYNALTSNGFMDAKGEWNESLFDMLRGQLKGMK